jgi:hypothetical protein
MKVLITRAGEVEEMATEGDDSYFLEIENFTAAASGDGEPRVSAAETLRTLDTIDRLVLAAGIGRPATTADPEPAI